MMHHLLAYSHKQSISNVPKPRGNHSLPIHSLIQPRKPNLSSLGPLPCRLQHSRLRAQNSQNDNLLHTPVFEDLDSSGAGPAGGDDGVEDEGELGGGCVFVLAPSDGGFVGEVVIVFDGGEGGGLAVETEMVDWDGVRKKGLNGW